MQMPQLQWRWLYELGAIDVQVDTVMLGILL